MHTKGRLFRCTIYIACLHIHRHVNNFQNACQAWEHTVMVHNYSINFNLTHFDIIFFYITFQIRDSKDHILSQRESISKGKFTFVTETYDTFEVCFISKVAPGKRGREITILVLIKLSWKHTNDWRINIFY